MKHEELNRRLAEVLGWEVAPGACVWAKSPVHGVVPGFSAADDLNHLVKYVLPEVFKRGLGNNWIHTATEVMDEGDAALDSALDQIGTDMDIGLGTGLTAGLALWFLSPAVLAEAALTVLEPKS